MNGQLEKICDELDKLAEAVLNVWGDDRTYNEALGWNAPAITRQEMASVATKLAMDIRATNVEDVPESVAKLVSDFPRRITHLQAHTVPQIPNGNIGQAAPAYLATLQYVRSQLLPELGWVAVPDDKHLPHKLIRRAVTANRQLDEATAMLEGLAKKVEEIMAAHAAATSLPTDLEDLKDAKEQVSNAVRKTSAAQVEAEHSKTAAATDLDAIKKLKEEAEKLVKNCEDAYRITTSKGLAGAFEERADRLAKSMWVWVAGLVASLICAYLVGGKAIDLFMNLFETEHQKGAGAQATLTALGVFAPLWFAWISTKQIGERFRLSEDYAFKASVSKAYEGYRREAAGLDEAFAARLFSSALTRLDEAPLRLVETENHGSPWHELIKGVFSARPKPATAEATTPKSEDAPK